MLEHALQEKGWTTEEIGKVRLAYQKLDNQRTAKHRMIDATIFILLLAFAVTLNATLALLVVPLFFFFPIGFLAVVLVIAGLAFGTLFAYLSKDIRTGHRLFMIVSAILSLLAFGLVFKSANEIEQMLGNPLRNTFLYAAAYVLCYIIPFSIIRTTRDRWT
jgi:hypothetical protein